LDLIEALAVLAQQVVQEGCQVCTGGVQLGRSFGAFVSETAGLHGDSFGGQLEKLYGPAEGCSTWRVVKQRDLGIFRTAPAILSLNRGAAARAMNRVEKAALSRVVRSYEHGERTELDAHVAERSEVFDLYALDHDVPSSA
jgi:hypothetical protein